MDISENSLSVVNVFTVDWVTVSFNLDVYSVIALLGLDHVKFSFSEKYSWGYPCTAEYGHIKVYYNPDDLPENFDIPRYPKAHKGCCLNMSGQGCRDFETYSPDLSWAMLFSRIKVADGNFTRLDLAYDDRSGVIFLPRLAMDVAERNFIGHARQTMRLYSDDIENDLQGLTVYVGSQKSDLFIRIYDKAAERGYQPSEMHWVRVEIEMRHDRAVLAADAVSTDPHIGHVFAGILANYLKIVTPNGDSNKSRWPVADYWEKLLHDVSALHLTMPGIEYNFRKSEVYFLKQYHQYLRAYYVIYGENAPQQLFNDCMNLCVGEDFKPKYLKAIQDFNAIYGTSEQRSAEAASFDISLLDRAYQLNDGLRRDNVALRSQLDHLRGILADLQYRDAETMSFYELFERDPDLPFGG